VAVAMLQCQKAGVRVIVMTGDSKETAVAIARDVNIFGRVRNTNP
jgi:P-type Ca2+ transporter type 2C